MGILIWLSILACLFFTAANLRAENALATPTGLAEHYAVRQYVITGKTNLATSELARSLSKHTGTDVSLEEIVGAAAELQLEYQRLGFSTMNIVIASRHITNGVVALNVFAGAVGQIVVEGNRYVVSSNGVSLAPPELAAYTAMPPLPTTLSGTAPVPHVGTNAASHQVSTNAGPRFTVEKYLVLGNTILPPETIARAVTNAPCAVGTNVSLEGIRGAANELQAAYRARGYVTVAVSLPPQKLTNATVKVQVTEGRLASILVKGNHYFSSNNVMSSVPGLHTNMILNGLTFQEELNQANASQDRQIYPVLGPGPDPGTSELTLKVKDRVPVHAKVDLDNQSSPGTPDLRVNTSAVYDNLWQQEQSLGVQYSFSPELYKKGSQWSWFDQPLVANYSGFYRIPLGGPQDFDELISSQPGLFGYNEATRKFNLPPAYAQPDITFFASRSAIDTRLNSTYNAVLFSEPGQNESENDVQQDLTENNDLGLRWSSPLAIPSGFHLGVSGGLDFKTYQVSSFKTNNFIVVGTNFTTIGTPILPPNTGGIASSVPTTIKNLQYLPLSFRSDADGRDPLGTISFGLGASVNLWCSGLTSIYTSQVTNDMFYRNVKSLRQITGSSESSGYWVVFTPSFSHGFEFVTNWPTMFKADGQWASEPLISNEQYGAGGVNSVRGYHEGEVFGDTGWHASLEQETPPRVAGFVNDHTPITLRGSIYTDFAQVYLLDPMGRAPGTTLWGVGLGGVASAGSHWEARFMFSVPLLSAGTVDAYQPHFNFSLTAQF